jgi:hypothetical protein
LRKLEVKVGGFVPRSTESIEILFTGSVVEV